MPPEIRPGLFSSVLSGTRWMVFSWAHHPATILGASTNRHPIPPCRAPPPRRPARAARLAAVRRPAPSRPWYFLVLDSTNINTVRSIMVRTGSAGHLRRLGRSVLAVVGLEDYCLNSLTCRIRNPDTPRLGCGGWGEARWGGAGWGGKGRGRGGAVRAGDGRPFRPPGHRRQPTWTNLRKQAHRKSNLNRIEEHGNWLTDG